MDVNALVNLEAGGRGLAGLVAALRRQNVALEALCSEEFRQIGQVLGGRGVVGPVILVDEEDSSAELGVPAAGRGAARASVGGTSLPPVRNGGRELWAGGRKAGMLQPRSAIRSRGMPCRSHRRSFTMIVRRSLERLQSLILAGSIR